MVAGRAHAAVPVAHRQRRLAHRPLRDGRRHGTDETPHASPRPRRGPGLVAGRPHDRLDLRSQRPRGGLEHAPRRHAPATAQQRAERHAAGLVARRPPDRVLRSVPRRARGDGCERRASTSRRVAASVERARPTGLVAGRPHDRDHRCERSPVRDPRRRRQGPAPDARRAGADRLAPELVAIGPPRSRSSISRRTGALDVVGLTRADPRRRATQRRPERAALVSRRTHARLRRPGAPHRDDRASAGARTRR